MEGGVPFALGDSTSMVLVYFGLSCLSVLGFPMYSFVSSFFLFQLMIYMVLSGFQATVYNNINVLVFHQKSWSEATELSESGTVVLRSMVHFCIA